MTSFFRKPVDVGHRKDSPAASANDGAAASDDRHVAMEGYLRRGKDGLLVYSVLWAEDLAGHLPARLDFYTEKRLFQRRHNPTNVVSVGDMRTVAHLDRNDTSGVGSLPHPSTSPCSMTLPASARFKPETPYLGFVIVMKGREDTAITLGCEKRQDREAWMMMLREFITKTPNPQRLGYGQIFHSLEMSNRSLGKRLMEQNAFSADQRCTCSFAFNAQEVALIRPQQVEPFFVCAMQMLPCCGAKENMMYVECGQQSPLGKGRIYMACRDPKHAETIKTKLVGEMTRGAKEKQRLFSPSSLPRTPMGVPPPHHPSRPDIARSMSAEHASIPRQDAFSSRASLAKHHHPHSLPRNTHLHQHTVHHQQPRAQPSPDGGRQMHYSPGHPPSQPTTVALHRQFENSLPQFAATLMPASPSQHTSSEGSSLPIVYARSVSNPCAIQRPLEYDPMAPAGTSSGSERPPLPPKSRCSSSAQGNFAGNPPGGEATSLSTSDGSVLSYDSSNHVLGRQLSESSASQDRDEYFPGQFAAQQSIASSNSSNSDIRPRVGAMSSSLRSSVERPPFDKQYSAPLPRRKISFESTASNSSSQEAARSYRPNDLQMDVKESRRLSSSCSDLQNMDLTDPGVLARHGSPLNAGYALLSAEAVDVAAVKNIRKSSRNVVCDAYEVMVPSKNLQQRPTTMITPTEAGDASEGKKRAQTMPVRAGGNIDSGDYEVMEKPPKLPGKSPKTMRRTADKERELFVPMKPCDVPTSKRHAAEDHDTSQLANSKGPDDSYMIMNVRPKNVQVDTPAQSAQVDRVSPALIADDDTSQRFANTETPPPLPVKTRKRSNESSASQCDSRASPMTTTSGGNDIASRHSSVSSTEGTVGSRSSTSQSESVFALDMSFYVDQAGNPRLSQMSPVSACSHPSCASCASRRSSSVMHGSSASSSGSVSAGFLTSDDITRTSRPPSMAPDYRGLEPVAATTQKFESFSRHSSEQKLQLPGNAVDQQEQYSALICHPGHEPWIAGPQQSTVDDLDRTMTAHVWDHGDCAADTLMLPRAGLSIPIPIASASNTNFVGQDISRHASSAGSTSWLSPAEASTDYSQDWSSSGMTNGAMSGSVTARTPTSADISPVTSKLRRQASRHGRYLEDDIPLGLQAMCLDGESIDSGFGSRSTGAKRGLPAQADTGNHLTVNGVGEQGRLNYQQVTFKNQEGKSPKVPDSREQTDYHLICPDKTQALQKAIQTVQAQRDLSPPGHPAEQQ